jgi:uncharacterized protein (TIGR02284 family)
MACFFRLGYKKQVMETMTSKQTAGVLSDLIRINNDRIAGYEKALKDLREEDKDLSVTFLKAIDQSRKNKIVLGNELQILGETIPDGTTGNGSIYRTWMELKLTFTGHSRHSILGSCEYGEDAAQNAYESALESEHLPEYLSRIVLDQKVEMKEVHDRVKMLRDQSAQ